LRWIDGVAAVRFEQAAAALAEISTIAKSLLLKIARAVNARRALDAAASFDAMAGAWDRATAGLEK
jgi:hypothetical protein